jgi:hypothetical protein
MMLHVLEIRNVAGLWAIGFRQPVKKAEPDSPFRA